VDRFSFFFAFYGLILGLAVAELLGGFAGIVRAHALKKLEAQTALVALLTFVLICATWVDTFTMDRAITLNFGATKVSFQAQADAPSCAECGSIMVRNGSCYKCLNCGSTSGCS